MRDPKPFKPEIKFEDDKRHDHEQSERYYDFCRWLYDTLTTETGESFDGRPYILISDNPIPEGPSIIAPMHRKALDITMAGSILHHEGGPRAQFISKHQNHYVFELLAKKHFDTEKRLGKFALKVALKLDTLPIYNMRKGGRTYPFDRDNPVPYMRGAIKWVKETIEDYKQAVVIFPEGTRIKEDPHLIGSLEDGPASFAIKHNVPLVSISFWENHNIVLKKWQFFKNGRLISRKRTKGQTPLVVYVGQQILPEEFLKQFGNKNAAKEAMTACLADQLQFGLNSCIDFVETELAA